MQLNRFTFFISFFCAMLSNANVAAMQSVTQSSSSHQSTGKIIVCGVAATAALISSALCVRTYCNKQKTNKSQQAVPTLNQEPVAAGAQKKPANAHNACTSAMAKNIVEAIKTMPAPLANVIADYAANEPAKKIPSLPPHYGFAGCRSR